MFSILLIEFLFSFGKSQKLPLVNVLSAKEVIDLKIFIPGFRFNGTKCEVQTFFRVINFP